MQNQQEYQDPNPVNSLNDDLNHINLSTRTGMLNELLRKQLSPDLPISQTQPPVSNHQDKQPNLFSCAVDVVEELLHNPEFERIKVHAKLSALFHQQQGLYQQTDIADEYRKRQYITHCGLVMSPEHCITTVLDDIRVRAFIRGTHIALEQKIPTKAEPLHLVYPACGPFAPLLIPLLSYYKAHQGFSPEQLQVTLIDMQPGAVINLEALVEEMGISDYIRQICCMDASEYQPEQESVDLVVLEAMQHGLSREGQISIARHFAKLLSSQGSIIPQKISVTANLVALQQEFVEQWRDAKTVSETDMQSDIKQSRIPLGEILEVSVESLSQMQEKVLDEHTILLECGTVQIPFLSEGHEQSVILSTRVNTWGDEWIGEYDSGITHPLPDQNICINFTPKEERPGDLLLKSGDGLKFYYRLNGLPGFLPTWAQGAS